MKPKQPSFLPRPLVEHGGDLAKGKRKVRRPFNPKNPIHLSMRSSRARGSWSLLRHKHQVLAQLQMISQKRGIRVYRFANVGNHLHLLIQARSRTDFRAFLREFAGVVAVIVTGAVKGSPQKFWDGIPWSKIVERGRQFKNAARYVLLNVMEASGMRDRALLARLGRDGIVMMGPEPGS